MGGAIGYLVGEPHKGLPHMFTMMNHARQGVGVPGLGISDRAYQQAVQYARERVQGKNKDGSKKPIIEYPDVRRMLLTMRSGVEAMRALALEASAALDFAHADNNSKEKVGAFYKSQAVLCLWTHVYGRLDGESSSRRYEFALPTTMNESRQPGA